jgi:hypothetical protein
LKCRDCPINHFCKVFWFKCFHKWRLFLIFSYIFQYELSTLAIAGPKEEIDDLVNKGQYQKAIFYADEIGESEIASALQDQLEQKLAHGNFQLDERQKGGNLSNFVLRYNGFSGIYKPDLDMEPSVTENEENTRVYQAGKFNLPDQLTRRFAIDNGCGFSSEAHQSEGLTSSNPFDSLKMIKPLNQKSKKAILRLSEPTSFAN